MPTSVSSFASEGASLDAVAMSHTTAAIAGLSAAVGFLTIVWVVSIRIRNAGIADICWGPGFALLAWLYLALAPQRTPRAWAVVALVSVWGLRLAIHIFTRSLGKGEDPRYAAMRAGHGEAFRWRSLFVVFWLQGALLWFVALPVLVAVLAARPAGLTALDGVGLLLFAIGFGFEVIGDRQLARFRSDPGNRGRVLDSGLWRYTRHPNYFGDATLWWGLFAIAAAVPGGWQTLLSPCLMTFLLLRVSGVSLLEDGLKTSRPGYQDYIDRTPAFVPWWPSAPR